MTGEAYGLLTMTNWPKSTSPVDVPAFQDGFALEGQHGIAEQQYTVQYNTYQTLLNFCLILLNLLKEVIPKTYHAVSTALGEDIFG